MNNMRKFIIHYLLRVKMFYIKYFLWKPLVNQTKNPKSTQLDLLLSILTENESTSFGKQHDFANINSIEAYRKNVPVHTYEELRTYIEKQEKEKKPYLNATQPIMYAQTSGTTGNPKQIPILESSVAQYKKSQHIVAYGQYKDIPGVYSGKVLAIVSPAEEGKLESGTTFGSMSGIIYKSMPALVREQYVVPSTIFEMSDYELKYYLIALFALASSDISLVATANPSTILKINKIIQQRWDHLVNDIKNGSEFGLPPDKKRAEKLILLKQKKAQLNFADFWPNLRCVTTWTGGNCAILIPDLKKLLGASTKIVEMGYLSSEFRGSITIDVLGNKSIPTIHENFFEFVSCTDWDNGTENFLTVDELSQGVQYYVFVTTRYGLYRYFINDIIEVDGQFNNTPTIRFAQKGKGVTNITGEKLYETQIIAAIQSLKQLSNLEFEFFMLLASPETQKYVLYIETEPFTDASYHFEKNVSAQNLEFREKRASDRLRQTEVVFLKPGTAEAYKKYCIDNGQREGQFKMSVLQYSKDCSFDFNSYRR